MPRYLAVARVLAHRARRALDLPVDLAAVAADLSLLEEAVAVEAWWWTGRPPPIWPFPPGWTSRPSRPNGSRRQAGDYSDTLRRAAARLATAGGSRLAG